MRSVWRLGSVHGSTGIEEIIICALDKREYQPFEAQLAGLGASVKEAA